MKRNTALKLVAKGSSRTTFENCSFPPLTCENWSLEPTLKTKIWLWITQPRTEPIKSYLGFALLINANHENIAGSLHLRYVDWHIIKKSLRNPTVLHSSICAANWKLDAKNCHTDPRTSERSSACKSQFRLWYFGTNIEHRHSWLNWNFDCWNGHFHHTNDDDGYSDFFCIGETTQLLVKFVAVAIAFLVTFTKLIWLIFVRERTHASVSNSEKSWSRRHHRGII